VPVRQQVRPLGVQQEDGVVMAAAWLVALMLTQTPRPADVPPAWDVPGALEALDVPGTVKAGGTPVAIHAVRSKERPEVLLESFRRQFSRAGLYLPPAREVQVSAAHPQVTGLDVDRRIAHTVFLQPNADGTVTVVISETNVGAVKSDAKPGVPLFPGATQVMTTNTEGVEAVSYRVKATREEVDDFHRSTLKPLGFETDDGSVWKKGEQQLAIRVKPREAGVVTVSVVKSVAPAAK
jgi:hypothetical protein